MVLTQITIIRMCDATESLYAMEDDWQQLYGVSITLQDFLVGGVSEDWFFLRRRAIDQLLISLDVQITS